VHVVVEGMVKRRESSKKVSLKKILSKEYVVLVDLIDAPA